MSKKFVFLSPFFLPEMISTGKYNGLVVEKIIENGGVVVVICSHPVYPDWKVSETDHSLNGAVIKRGGLKIPYPKNSILRRAVLESWYAFHVFIEVLKIRGERADYIVVFPPSLFMLCVSVLLPRNIKVTGIIHDLQGVYAAKLNGIVTNVVFRLISIVESLAFSRCNKLIFLSETMRKVAVDNYNLDSNLVRTHYPFVTIGEINEGLQPQLDPFFLPELKSMVYSGALGDKQSPEELVLFFTTVLDRYPDWQAVVFSQGPIFNELKTRISHDRLRFFPLVDIELLPTLLRRSDIQVVPQASGTSDGSLPSKLPNIIASGARLLCITDQGSELELIVKQYSAGVVSNLWNTDVLLDKFQQLTSMPRAAKESTQGLMRKFSLDALVEELLDVQ